jgi:hypothetical protein
VYLFDARQLRDEQIARGVKRGLASSVTKKQWDAAQIYPTPVSHRLTVSPQQSELLEQFAGGRGTELGLPVHHSPRPGERCQRCRSRPRAERLANKRSSICSIKQLRTLVEAAKDTAVSSASTMEAARKTAEIASAARRADERYRQLEQLHRVRSQVDDIGRAVFTVAVWTFRRIGESPNRTSWAAR